ncbi:elongation factor Tu [Roseovarius sp. TM1035]|jgi:hypothetical protein|uniref:hypothetical protein n=1 Tax=Roseovarius TaxID=74030 RepID=UPI000155784A|nr:hypothetical protein [Roseovarius sp. TM1035]EDM30817.1 elongation factor Tu [Roseovarius sp. TM1035]|tara:strand:- start:835 stop:1491 length:657 start_codon:yes stop_codon:yes gene_type:complete
MIDRRVFVSLSAASFLVGCQTTADTAGSTIGTGVPQQSKIQTNALGSNQSSSTIHPNKALTLEQTKDFRIEKLTVVLAPEYERVPTELSFTDQRIMETVQAYMNAIVRPADPMGDRPVHINIALKGAYIKPEGRMSFIPPGGAPEISTVLARATVTDATTGEQLGRGLDLRGQASAATNILMVGLVGTSAKAKAPEEEVKLFASALAGNARVRLFGPK